MFFNFPEHKLLVNSSNIASFEMLEPFEAESGTMRQKLIMHLHKPDARYVLFSGDPAKAANIWNSIYEKLQSPAKIHTINTIRWRPQQE